MLKGVKGKNKRYKGRKEEIFSNTVHTCIPHLCSRFAPHPGDPSTWGVFATILLNFLLPYMLSEQESRNESRFEKPLMI